LKARILLDRDKPKVAEDALRKVVQEAGLKVDGRKSDIGVVVGGDGVFSRFGRTESIPLLFVGVRSRAATGSKAYLAAAYFDELPEVLAEVDAGRFTVKEYKRLKVEKNSVGLGEVFTDVYLQRGADSNCIRYKVKVNGEAQIEDSAIGDGVVISTSAGSTGYYSYPDKIKGERLEAGGHSSIGDDQVGICHVVPTYTERSGSSSHPLRYTVPWGSRIEVSMTRRADARLYGVGEGRGGMKVKVGDKIVISPSAGTTKVVVLKKRRLLGQAAGSTPVTM
jgi:NAD+ kinase